MALTIKALPKLASESILYVFNFEDFAEVVAGETLSSPSVPAVSGLTIGTPTVTTTVIDDVPIGKGVQCLISGGTAGITYSVDCFVTMSGGDVRGIRCRLQVS